MDPLRKVAELLTGSTGGASAKTPAQAQTRYGVVTGTTAHGLLVALGGDTVSVPAAKLAEVKAGSGDTVKVEMRADSATVVGTIGSSAPPTGQTAGTGSGGIGSGDPRGTGSVSYSPGWGSVTPIPVASVYGAADCGVRITGYTASGFTFAVFRSDGSNAPSAMTVPITWNTSP